MLLANYAQQNRNCVRELGVAFTNPLAQFKPQLLHAFAVQGDYDATIAALRMKTAWPNGYNTQYAWWPALKDGGLGSTCHIRGAGSIEADALAVKLAEAALTGDGDLEAIGSLIVQAIAALTASGGISNANIRAFLQAVAALSGSGDVDSADLEALGALIADIAGSGTAAGSEASGIGELLAALVVTGSGLTTANVGEAVWSAIAASNNAAGTMGEKLNDAGSASNPWTEVIESGYTAAEILRLLAAVAQGNATGLEGTDVVFKSLDGNTDRITATLSNGDRTVTARDAT